MKFKPFLVALCALCAILAGCEQPEPEYEEASIELSTNCITLEAGAVSQTVTLNTTRQWKVKDLTADWVTVSPMSGDASFDPQTITISVLPNTEHNRTVDIEFFGGIVSDILTVNQNGEKGVVLPGDGSLENPFSASEAHDYVAALPADASTSQYFYIKGVVSKVVSIDTGTYGNANFYIVDEDDPNSADFYCFQIMYLDGKKFSSEEQLKVGDKVTVYAQVVNFKGNTPETVGKGSGKLYSVNGKQGEGGGDDVNPGTPEGSGTKDDPFNATAAHNAAAALAADAPTTEYYYIKGVVSKIVSIDTGTYGNANFYITDDGKSSSTDFYCFQIMYLGGEKFTSSNQLKVGDEVVVYAQLTNYRGNTPETVGKGSGKLISINGKTEGEEGDDDDDNPVVKTAYKYNKATAVTAGKQYLIVAEGQAATAITGNYGYLQVKAVEDEDGVITVVPESLDFTFETTDGGYYIKQADGRYLYMSGEYNSFNVSATPDAAAVWTVEVSDGEFIITNVAMSKTIQFDTTYSSYGSYPDVRGVYPVLYEKTDETVEVEEETGGGSTNVKWTKGSGGYDDVTVTANGQSVSPAFKLGTSKAGGEITFTIPAGTKKISFYAVSWKGNATTLTLSAGGNDLKTFNPAANDGASNNSPFTISVSASDWYSLEYEFTAETQVTFSSPKRVVFWNVHAE